MHTLAHTVRLSDTDATGQVYYARPLEWLEWCRVDWFTQYYGNFLNYVKETNVTFFPSAITLEYKKPMFFGDELEIEMRARKIKKVSFTFDYIIRRQDEVVLKSEITMACFDVRKKQLSLLPMDLLQHLETLS